MPKPTQIELPDAGVVIPILYEDRSLLAVDKPAGWLLAPDSWDRTGRNLSLALQSSLNAGDFWARSRNLKYLRFIHRLDAETTGLLLFAKSPGALRAYSEMFENREIEKTYLAVARGTPRQTEWVCELPLMPDPQVKGRMRTAPARGAKDARTRFRVIATLGQTALIEAHPETGRTHQIRVHLASAGLPIVGDPLYGGDPAAASRGRQRIALRAVRLKFRDPFQKRMTRIEAPLDEFAREYGFDPAILTANQHK